MKHAFTLLFALIVASYTLQAQTPPPTGYKQESFTSSTGTYYYWADYLTDNGDPDYRNYIVSNPHSGIFVVDSGNGKFNCHAFAWPNDTTVWVQPNYQDTSAPWVYYNGTTLYYGTTTASDAEIAVYGDPSTTNPIHSALRLTNSNSSNGFARAFLSKYPQYVGWYISKWDGGPLVIHQVDSCPFYAQSNETVTYYKKKSEASGSNSLEYSSSQYSIAGAQNIVCYSPGNQFWLSNAAGSIAITSFPQSGFSVTWSASSNITLSNANALPVTASFNGNSSDGATGQISATIYFPNGTSGTVGPYTVWAGPPAPITSISTSQFTAGGNGETTITVPSSSAEFYAWPFNTADVVPPNPASYDTHGASSYWWTCSSGGGPAITWNQDQNLIGYRYAAGGFTPANEYGIITVRAYNACGSQSAFQNILESSSDDAIAFTLSPNPASDVVTVSIASNSAVGTVAQPAAGSQATPVSGGSTGTPVTYAVKVVDLSGIVYYASSNKGNKFTIPVSTLKPGSYMVVVTDGKNPSGRPLVIVH
jgi:Secretion system C-terminal sorting domain